MGYGHKDSDGGKVIGCYFFFYFTMTLLWVRFSEFIVVFTWQPTISILCKISSFCVLSVYSLNKLSWPFLDTDTYFQNKFWEDKQLYECIVSTSKLEDDRILSLNTIMNLVDSSFNVMSQQFLWKCFSKLQKEQQQQQKRLTPYTSSPTMPFQIFVSGSLAPYFPSGTMEILYLMPMCLAISEARSTQYPSYWSFPSYISQFFLSIT